MLVIRFKTFTCLVLSIVILVTVLGLFYDFYTVEDDSTSSSTVAKKFLRSWPSEKKKCRDWHDYEFIEYEKRRTGPGENGTKVLLTDENEIKLNAEAFEKTGFYVYVSDKISVNRSIPDRRPVECQELKYLHKLPSVSVIIIFHNEVMSVLKRTIHSVINRTPSELLHEIILVNDASVNEELYEPLAKYVRMKFPPKVKIINLKSRHGLIRTRLKGAERATGEILVFFDSHMEVNTNWLPPLIEPIVKNKRISTLPVIDSFDPETFEFYLNDQYGDRAVMDWKLVYKTFPRYLPESAVKHKPYPTPIMLGCAFAIDRKFFMEELGGYDEGFEIWNAENYELSFKLWLCADGVIVVPCSHVTHTFRRINPSRKLDYDYEGKNFKRLAEVWMEEFKEIVYNQNRVRYDKIDPGDLTKPLAVKARLTCKPFMYFLDKIAPEIYENFPTDPNEQSFAAGRIKSMIEDDACIDTFGSFMEFGSMGVFYCQNDTQTSLRQKFRLTFTKNIVNDENGFCLDSYKFSLQDCSFTPYGNQYWYYDHRRHLIINGHDSHNECISADFENQTLSLAVCDTNSPSQLWKFENENLEALNNWESLYGYSRPENFHEMTKEKLWPIEYEFCDDRMNK